MTHRGELRVLSVAPMMDRTDRHFRMMMRQLTKHTLLYTEMVTTGALIYGDRDRHLSFSEEEKPLSLQLGGDDPKALAECARMAMDYGYDEVNINVGCPSDRVQSGNFGACLMAHPEQVARCVETMRKVVDLPVTVKHRIGIDDHDSYAFMAAFVRQVAQAGADRFTVHARIAILRGLSPKQNRTVPPLRYSDVYRLKRDHPDLFIEINGGVGTLEDVMGHLDHVDAAMVGRAAYDNPYLFAQVDRALFGASTSPPSRRQVVEAMLPYAEDSIAKGARIHDITRRMLTLYSGQPGARAWRRILTEGAGKPNAGPSLLQRALKAVSSAGYDAQVTVCSD